MRVVIAGGGTAGHVNPAIAVAGWFEREEVTFVGTKRGAEASLVPAAGFPVEFINVGGWDRSRPLSIVPTGARASSAVVHARRLLRRTKPDVTLGMGGYVSLPACLAARSLRIPVIIHEQNIVFGLANRTLKPWARTVAVSFEQTLPQAGRRGVFTGNPVGPDFVDPNLDAERRRGFERFGFDPDRKTLLIFGGSQGAGRINRVATELTELWSKRGDLQLLHITGPDYSPRPITGEILYRTIPRVDRMIEAYAIADLAICRGGATTVAELAATGVPSIIVPYPHHRDRQQERHGRVFENAGAARVLLDHDATGPAASGLAGELLDDDALLTSMRLAASSLAKPEAAEHLAGLVRECAA
jgi:UDP-N-acetylglucosamine--N-acetylmuramyl-(pentapeptide) pyrophosphoryl-undecaprenol N-acetylglucosamine transferase